MRTVDPGSADPVSVGVVLVRLGDAGSVAVSAGVAGAVVSAAGPGGVGGVSVAGGVGTVASGRVTASRRDAARQLLRSLRSRTRRNPSAQASRK